MNIGLEAIVCAKPATERKVLKLKASNEPAPAELSPTLEAQADVATTAANVAPARSEEAPSTPPPQTQSKPTWTEADETILRSLMARRKAAGYQNRGRDVGAQLIKVSDIHPNAGTIAATIVGLVEAKGTVSRAELIKLMGKTPFPQPKAKPHDQGWCQGYVAGAIRNGFLTVVDEAPVASSEAC